MASYVGLLENPLGDKNVSVKALGLQARGRKCECRPNIFVQEVEESIPHALVIWMPHS